MSSSSVTSACRVPFRVVCVEGVIGAGKTTLLRSIAAKSKVRHRLTVVAEPIEAWKDVRKATPIPSVLMSGAIPVQTKKSVNHDSSSSSSSISMKSTHTDSDETSHNEDDESDCDRQYNVLEQMYLNPKRWSFTFQMWALMTYSETMTSAIQNIMNEVGNTINHSDDEHQNSTQRGRILLMERSIFANRVFAGVMYELGSLNDMEWSMYQHTFNYVQRNTENIHAVAMMDVDPRVALQRCRDRARDGEECVTEDYMKRLHKEYGKVLPQIHEHHCVDVFHLPDDSTKFDMLDQYLTDLLDQMDAEYDDSKSIKLPKPS